MKKVLLPRKNPSNPVIKAYVEAVQAGEKMYHVTPDKDKWVVKSFASKSGRMIFDNIKEAQAYAVKMAKKDK